MALFSRRPKTRAEILSEADRARGRGQLKKAVAGYRKALESDPADPSVNVKLAPLLARRGQAEAAAACFRNAARRHLEQGFTDRAAGVNAAATSVFPLDTGFRIELARLNVLRGRRQDAVETLLEGGTALAKARRPDVAASLLSRALEIEPWHLEAALALVPILARAGREAEAHRLVAGLEARRQDGTRRRIRWVAFRTWPGLGTLWRWLRT